MVKKTDMNYEIKWKIYLWSEAPNIEFKNITISGSLDMFCGWKWV